MHLLPSYASSQKQKKKKIEGKVNSSTKGGDRAQQHNGAPLWAEVLEAKG